MRLRCIIPIWASLIASAFVLTACFPEAEFLMQATKQLTRESKSDSEQISTPVPQGYKVGKPYTIAGIKYFPQHEPTYEKVGIASWYGEPFHGKKTANGEIYDMNALTAAHKTIALPSLVRVTNLDNKRTLTLRVNDRGPFVNGRIIDISRRGAQLLGFYKKGTAKVRVKFLKLATLKSRRVAPAKELMALEEADVQQSKMTTSEVMRQQTERIQDRPVITTSYLQKPKITHSNIPATETSERIQKQKYTPATNPQKGIFIQFGAFSEKSRAIIISKRLPEFSFRKLIIPINVNGTKLYRVRMGPFKTARKAEIFLTETALREFKDAKIILVH